MTRRRMAFDGSLDIAKLHASVARWVTADPHQGVFATDAQLRVVLWNRWMEIHSGHDARDLIGRSLLELYPDVRERGLTEYYENALNGRVTILSHVLHRFVLALPATNPDAGFAQMPQTGRIGPLTDGNVIGTVTIIEDVSDRIASEAELRKQIEAQQRARATAEKALRAKDDFLSTLSHEMRTPLNAVLGWAKILLARQDVDRELLDRALNVIERNASAQAKLIDDMLDMARIVAGKLRLEMQPVDLLGVVLAAIDIVMPSANAKRITVRTRLDPKTPRVIGDQDRLQQVVWNLLSNALKFTDAGGSIDVQLRSNGNSAQLVIADSGHGINPKFLPFVFERFRQADSSSGRRHGGLGLGLALVRDLVELHGGSVRADSEGEGKGACFTIDLPAVMSPDMRQSHGDRDLTRKEPVSSLAAVRVLLVEDESDSRNLAVTALEHSGAQVSAVSSSSEALAVLLDTPLDLLPHVIVSDIGMPREDGYELIRRIRSLETEHRRIPAVAVTGYATLDDVDRALAAGFQRHVAKPMDPNALVAAVAELARSNVLDPS